MRPNLILKTAILIAVALLPAHTFASSRAIWAVCVGVNDYGPHIPALNYAVSDCGHFTDFLGTLADDPDVHIVTLTTDQSDPVLKPTRANIMKAVADTSAKAGPTDEFWFYFSGHGVSMNSESYLASMDIDVRDVVKTIVSIHDIRAILQNQCKAAIRVVVADACESGSPRRIIEVAMADHQNAPNILTIAACKPNQCAWETGSIWGGQGGGVFTYYLIRCLAGESVDPTSPLVTVGAIDPYLSTQVPTAVEQLTRAQQNPVIIRGTSVPTDADIAKRNADLLRTLTGQVQNVVKQSPMKAIVVVDAIESRTWLNGQTSMANHVLRSELNAALLGDGMVVYNTPPPPAKSEGASMKVYKLTCNGDTSAAVLPDSAGFVTATVSLSAELVDRDGQTVGAATITLPHAGATEQSAYTKGVHDAVTKLISKLAPTLDKL